MNNLAPIILFIYNRPWHTKQAVEALQKNELAKDSLLYVFSDGPKSEKDVEKAKEVREYIKTIEGFKEVFIKESEKNKGLANSIISGVTEVINKHGKAIVLEDDLVISPYFLKYMNKALNFYKNNKKIFSISEFNLNPSVMKFPQNYPNDVYLNYRNCSWGWGTWKDRWVVVDWEVKDFEFFKKSKRMQRRFNRAGKDLSKMLIAQMERKIDSWAIRWCYAHFKADAYCVFPVKSYVDNIGHDGSGVHCGSSSLFRNEINLAKRDVDFPKELKLNQVLIQNYCKVFNRSFYEKVKSLIKKLLMYDLWKRK